LIDSPKKNPLPHLGWGIFLNNMMLREVVDELLIHGSAKPDALSDEVDSGIQLVE
jgi:hypothetical protein